MRRLALTLYLTIVLIGSMVEFYDIAWGTGEWLGEMSRTWAVLFSVFAVLCMMGEAILIRVIWKDDTYQGITRALVNWRHRLAWWRWLMVGVAFVFPVWLLQFTPIGVVLHGLSLRLLLWNTQLLILGYLITRENGTFVSWRTFLFCMILTASLFSIFASLREVTGYPFSLGWSEGNRLWDYSIMFGRDRYDYPADQGIPVYLDRGRQLVGGIPFLFPGLTIGMERAWVALTSVLPYILLGAVVFRHSFGDGYIWLASTLWAYLFLKQGPIHPPLVLCAVLVALAWRSRLWFSIPMIVFASYAARSSRITWMFAPVIWIIQLWVLDGGPSRFRFSERRKYIPAAFFAILLGSISIFLIIHYKFGGLSNFLDTFFISPEFIIRTLSQQSLLWYRLLPNETYGAGILVGLAVSVLPLVATLVYLLKQQIWQLEGWQQWVMLVVPLLGFLVVGLVVSTKIGGGGDLHNMDMFLIGLFFVGAVAFYHGGREWLLRSGNERVWVQAVLLLMFAIPGIGPLLEMRGYNFESSSEWLFVLTDAPKEKGLDMYPPEQVVDEALETIQQEVDLAREHGDVLFVDQRQLLTFEFIENVPLVPEYDKKVLIEEAMTGNRTYFQEFYRDLEEHRFSLIIVQPLNTSKKESEYEFGEEGNAWLEWVGRPLLCFYEIKETMKDVNVQLLVPRSIPRECVNMMPS